MTITISLPTDTDAKDYLSIKSYLKQLELSVIHAQKSVESAEKMGIEVSEDSSVFFKHPMLEDNNLTENEKKEGMSGFATDYFEDLQKIELEINL